MLKGASLDEVMNKGFNISVGDWTLQLEALKDNVVIMNASTNVTIVSGANEIDITLSPLDEGTGNLSFMFSYPESLNVKQCLIKVDNETEVDYIDKITSESEVCSYTYAVSGLDSGMHVLWVHFIYGDSNKDFYWTEGIQICKNLTSSKYIPFSNESFTSSDYFICEQVEFADYFVLLPPYREEDKVYTFRIIGEISDFAAFEEPIRNNQETRFILDFEYATLADNVTTFGSFSYSNVQKVLKIPEGITALAGDSFFCCDELTEIQLPSTLKALEGVSRNRISSIDLPEGLETIGSESFAFQEVGISLVIPSTVSFVGGGLLANTSGSISLAEGNPYLVLVDGVLYNTEMTELYNVCEKNVNLVVPASVEKIRGIAGGANTDSLSFEEGSKIKTIEEHAFEGLPMDELILPEGLTGIDNWCFAYASLQSITFPSTINYLGYEILINASNLKEIVIKAVNPPQIEGNFVGNPYAIPGDLVIKVPTDSVETYKNNPSWIFFEDRIVPIGDPSAVIGLKAGERDSDSVAISWTKSDDAQSYRIYLADNCDFENSTLAESISNSSTVSTELTGLSENTRYFIKVQAVNSDGTEGLSPSCISIYTAAGGDLIPVTGGTFSMVSKEGSPSVKVDDFYISKYEVTQAEYQAELGKNPSYQTGNHRHGDVTAYSSFVNKPVTNISIKDIVFYCNKRSINEGLTPCYITHENQVLTIEVFGDYDDENFFNNLDIDFTANGYRLPTEEEWEYAAIGGAATNGYTYSGSNNIDDVAWYDILSKNMWDGAYEDNYRITFTVGQKAANELGLYDMSGNVSELTWKVDGGYYSTDLEQPIDNPGKNDFVNELIVRGGCVFSSAENCTVTSVCSELSDYLYGFRVVRTK